ncbi:hypothetical protein MMC07_007143 [Pseudocyphellaria aurata]|nr:hypothetical protein [Pseudocyphellaria aurata]
MLGGICGRNATIYGPDTDAQKRKETRVSEVTMSGGRGPGPSRLALDEADMTVTNDNRTTATPGGASGRLKEIARYAKQDE